MAITPNYDPNDKRPGGAEPQRVTSSQSDEARAIIQVLDSYRYEAEENRRGGLNGRDWKWQENLNLYWNRVDFSAKAPWQAKETMPEVPAFVDRFAGALKEALVGTPNSFYSVVDPADQENDVASAIKRAMDVWLSSCGRNQTGTYLDFASVFEEQMKLGAIMACSSVVLWKGDKAGGRVAVETVDPRFVWLDHTYRNLYRIRRIEIDKHELKTLKGMRDGRGTPIYNLEEIDRMCAAMIYDDMQRKEEASGHGNQVMSSREPIVLEEYIATVVDNAGKVLADRALIVVANREYLIRGPEKNPFWHGKDWLVFTPLIDTPLSVYGRSYMEDFGSVAATFNELTNLILDAVRVSALRAYAVVPEMLSNPGQINEGLTPNKLFLLEGGNRAQDFAAALELGQLPPEVIQVWTSIKNELREAADINEIGLGQFAPKGRTSATEIATTQESSSALIRSIAQTVETRYLNPTLDLVWQTGLQHARASDPVLQSAVGSEMWGALMGRRKELASRPITFQARGISTMMQNSRMLRNILGLFGAIGSNQVLAQAFIQAVDMGKLVQLLFQLSGIDITKLQLSERERLIQSVAQPMQAAGSMAPGAPAPNPAQQQMAQGTAEAMGVQRGA